VRLRYFLAANLPLNTAQMTDGTFYASAYNELFVHTEAQAFDRNRLYGGLGYRFSRYLRVELGYMNQFLRVGERDQLNIVAFLSL